MLALPGTPSGSGAGGVATDRKDPVADLGPLQDQADRTTNRATIMTVIDNGDGADLELVGEDEVQRLEAVHLADVLAGHGSSDEFGYAGLTPCSTKNVPRVIRKLGMPVRITR